MSRTKLKAGAAPLQPAVHPLIETLEGRRLLSGGGFASLSRGGTLSIQGTRRADVMYVAFERRHRGTLDAVVNGHVASFSASQVKNVVMVGGAGDDDIIVDDSHGTVPGKHDLIGGAGNDTLLGDAGNDTLEGDAGDDSLVGNAGNDSLDGGDGNDMEVGDAGTDTLNGDAGDDSLDGGDGTDSVTGGDGVNHFHGNHDGTGEIKDNNGSDVNDDNGVDASHGGGTVHDSALVLGSSMKKDVFA